MRMYLFVQNWNRGQTTRPHRTQLHAIFYMGRAYCRREGGSHFGGTLTPRLLCRARSTAPRMLSPRAPPSRQTSTRLRACRKARTQSGAPFVQPTPRSLCARSPLCPLPPLLSRRCHWMRAAGRCCDLSSTECTLTSPISSRAQRVPCRRRRHRRGWDAQEGCGYLSAARRPGRVRCKAGMHRRRVHQQQR